MEKRVNKQIEDYVGVFKDEIKAKMLELNFDDGGKTSELLEFIYEYNRLILNKDDFIKRKRVKNAIPTSNRCTAKRANGEQCSRRKKDGCDFCGTHSKGVPHGLMSALEAADETSQKMEVFAKEICGIVYYIDKFSNVFNTEDVMNGKDNPRIIAKYVVSSENDYSIPQLGI